MLIECFPLFINEVAVLILSIIGVAIIVFACYALYVFWYDLGGNQAC